MPQMEATPTWLKVGATAPRIGVDRENKTILGAVVAQEGAFRESDPRGEFDGKALKEIVRLMKAKSPAGLKARFGHPNLSGDAAGSAIGRWHNPRLDSVTVDRNGEKVTLQAVRADLRLDASAFEVNPNGNLGDYMLTIAESDPGLISSSLVLQVNEEFRLNKDGTPKLGEDGKPLPPLWRPTVLHAADITDEGAAVDQLLSPGGADMADAVVRQGSEMLNRLFPNATRDVIEARCSAYLGRYLDGRFGTESASSLSASQRVLAMLWSVSEAEIKSNDAYQAKRLGDGIILRNFHGIGGSGFDLWNGRDDGASQRLKEFVGTVTEVLSEAAAPKPIMCPYDDQPCQEGCASADECEQEYEAGLAKDEPLHAEIEIRRRSME